ncbi:shikimate kinase [Bengtsoniella intestinalis]|uniref:shikimate kinase n=1 Tax=Bengtsoniella intestinalis TaxID=3073143 RepID=UPI00391FA4FB
MGRYGILGRVLLHSWSPPIHNAFGCTNYHILQREPEELPALFADPAMSGINVTIPYKQTVMEHCVYLDPLAVEIGAVNTMVRHADGYHGYNTDAYGFAYMAKVGGVGFDGKKVVVLGSGGSSLMVQTVVKRAGASSVIVVSRGGVNNYENLHLHADAQVIVNTTPLGMYPKAGVSPVDLTAFPCCEGVLDLVYNPQKTALLLQAEAMGIPHGDGLPMLVAQAKAADELYMNCAIADEKIDAVVKQIRHQVTNIVLVGMPSSGKSTVGDLLAQLSARTAVDLDQGVEQSAGCTIPELFAAQGEAGFRAVERVETMKAGQGSGQVIVTGGGVVKDLRNHDALRQNGRVYHLVRDVEKLSRDGRPLSANADLEAMWQERAPLYAQASDVTVDNNGAPEETADMIWRDFCEYFGVERP